MSNDSLHGLNVESFPELLVDRPTLRFIVGHFGAECAVVARGDADGFMEFNMMGSARSCIELAQASLEQIFAEGATLGEVTHLEMLARHALVVPFDADGEATLIVLRTEAFEREESTSIVNLVQRWSSRAQRSWFGVIAHHVNNLAQAILGAAELTAHGERDFLPEISTSARRLGALGGALAAISGGRSSHGSSARADVSELVGTVQRTDFGPRGRAMLHRQLPDSPVFVAVGSLPLVRIIREVVDNALDAAPARSTVELVATIDDASARILVDNELEAPVDAARFTEPFYTTKSSSHFGMGLPVARSLAVAVGGELFVSEVGGRLRVEIVLPLADVATDGEQGDQSLA